MSSAEREEFERVWTAPTGFRDWFATVNNQPFGNRFMVSSLVFFLLAGIMALLMRVQLAFPDNDLLGPAVYNQLFTMHGSTMMYLVVLPFLEGLAVYLIPIAIGAREMAFPRMSAFSFWVFFSGGIVFFSGFLVDAVPDTGWFVYPPLSLAKHSGLGLDFLLVGLGFIEIAGVGTGIEIVTTILKLRAPGMSLGRMPLFAWAWLVTAIMIVFAFSTLFGATVLIELDRALGTRFFDATGGGNPLLWQHLFWFFGHPDVYIMFLPATGMISMIIPTFARRPIAGYRLVAVAIVLTGFISFGLWVHHMFTTGMPALAMGFFTASSLMIALASGIQVFAWIATLWRSGAALKTPFLFALGFLFLFVLGGLTGVMVAVVPFDWQVHDTYFVVAHFHYVLIGGVIFPILAAVHYWLPLMIDRMPSERLGKLSFWLIFVGFNAAFFPMHAMGLKGMPRRVYTYSEALGVDGLNLMSTGGAFILGAGFLVVVANVLWSRKWGEAAPLNPWQAGSLDWSVKADMSNYIFLTPPTVANREPLWQGYGSDDRLLRIAASLTALPAKWRATLVTDAVTGEPQAIQKVAGPSYLPIIAALGMLVTSVATLLQGYLVALAGLVFTAGTAVVWLWPREAELKLIRDSDVPRRTGLTVAPIGSHATPWWAMIGALTVVGTVFGVLFYSYFYLRVYAAEWPQGGIGLPALAWPAVTYALPLAAAVPTHLAWRAFRTGRKLISASLLGVAAILALAALVLLVRTSATASFAPTANAYASLFHVITWHVAAVMLGGAGLLVAGVLCIPRAPGPKDGYALLQLQITRLYWWFAAGIGLCSYAVVHLSPHFF